jgi:hypothetical protein
MINKRKVVVINGQAFDSSIKHFHLNSDLSDMDELKKLSDFECLVSANFAGTNLNDIGLNHVSDVADIEGLNLQWTKISDRGVGSLAALPRLVSLRLKDNDQLTNECIAHLCKLSNLNELQIHGTSINHDGLQALPQLKNLRDLCIESENCSNSFEIANALSLRMPRCRILVKGQGEFFNGRFIGKWRN